MTGPASRLPAAITEVREEVEALTYGLSAKGFKRGDRLAIVGDNRPRLYWAMCAAQALGGNPVPMYQNSIAEELQYVLDAIACWRKSPAPIGSARTTLYWPRALKPASACAGDSAWCRESWHGRHR